MTAKELLIAARDYISDPNRWTQGVSEDSHGRCCAIGALRKVNRTSKSELIAEWLLDLAAGDLYQCDLEAVNDFLGHRETLKVYDEAIRRCDQVVLS